MKNVTIGVACVCFFGMVSCSNGEMQSRVKVYDFERADSLPVGYLRELGNIRIGIELAAEFNKSLKENGFAYNSSVMNPSNKASRYSNSKIQAINLGIYGADLNYATSFQQAQDVRGYLETVIKLAETLGVQSAFKKELIEQLTQSDSGYVDRSVILTRAYQHAEEHMYSEERAHLATMMVVGGWIESLYIATSALMKGKFTADIIPSYWDNSYTYNNVKKMLEVFKDKYQECAELLKDLKALEPALNAILQAQYSIELSHITELHKPLEQLRNKLINQA